MGRRTYITKMGPKKPVKRPINYVKSRPSFERMLKEWKARHQEYYKEFKERVETGFINDDPKVIDEFSKLFAVMPFLQNKNSDELLKAFTPSKGKSYEDYEWDEKKEALNWVSNDLDVAISETLNPMSPENIPAWKKFFVDDGLDDHTCALFYWFMLDDGQLMAMMALGRSMERENLSAEQIAQGDFLTKGVVEKGVQTGCFHKSYWDKIFSWQGLSAFKQRVASVLMTTKGKGGRNANIYILREIINGPDKQAILKNIERVVTKRKKDTDLACLLVLLVRTGNIDENIKYKPFHEALKSQFPDAGIGTERRPQQLYNNMIFYGGKTLTSNTLRRCEELIEEHRKALQIQ